MRPVLRLATNRLFARRNRTTLVVAAVALAAALITVVSTATATVNEAIRQRLNSTVGAADIILKPAGPASPLPTEWTDHARRWPDVALAAPSRQEGLSLSLTLERLAPDADRWTKTTHTITAPAVVQGVDWQSWNAIRPLTLLAGRLPRADSEVLVDTLLAERLTSRWESLGARGGGYGMSLGLGVWAQPPPSVPDSTTDDALAESTNARTGLRPGDSLTVRRFLRPAFTVTVVGIVDQPPLGGRPQLYASLPALHALLGSEPRLSQVEIVLADGADPDAFVALHAPEIPPSLVLQTTARVTASVEDNVASSQLGLILVTVLGFLTAAFIIFTGLTLDSAAQQRQLAMLRCIGASRPQLALSQLTVGLAIGAAGAILGVPLGLAIASLLWLALGQSTPVGLQLSSLGLILAPVGACGAGVIGAAWPAWRASRISPLRALAPRANAADRRAIAIATLAAAVGLGIHLTTAFAPSDSQTMFWAYATLGLPAVFVGYFFLAVPTVILVSRTLGPLLARVLRLPTGLVERLVAAEPHRYGFTAGAMMAGLALMVALWTQGGALLRDWILKLKFPDAFVSGLALDPELQRTLDRLPFIERTCAITLYPVQTDSFGVRALQDYYSTFIAFEPEPFFQMAELTWIEGDPVTAQRRLERGGAIIVAREFRTAQGLGVGDTFTCRADDREASFEIVGVVTSPGLDIVSKFFDIGAEYTHQSLHAVFGSRADLKRCFDADTAQLVQIDLADDVPDDAAMAAIWEAVTPFGVLDAGSGRAILSEITSFIRAMLLASSAAAVINMLIASLGVANVIINSVESRRFEIGVLRAVGGTGALLTRMIAAEAALIALTAGLLGALMGTQLSLAAQRLHAKLLGLTWDLKPPPVPIAAGCAILLAICLLASLPAMLRLNRLTPRELLAARPG